MEYPGLQKGFDWGRESLKWIAMASMTIDHIGSVLYPDLIVLRIIGRFAFPLYGYLLVLGVDNSKSVKEYFVRLFLFALVSQVPYYLAFGYAPLEVLNIFFTLSFGVLIIRSPFLILLFGIASLIVNFDFGIYGLIMIACIKLLKTGAKYGLISLVLLSVASLLLWDVQIFSLFAIPLIILHKNGHLKVLGIRERPPYPPWGRYLYYIYYPLHLTILYMIKTFLA